MLLVCLLGSNALAQTRTTYTTTTEVKEIIDFTGWEQQTNNTPGDADIIWNGNNITSIQGKNGNNLNREFTNFPISVGHGGDGDTGYWRLWKGSHLQTYLQKHNSSDDTFSIGNLQKGDVVTIWGDGGQNNNGGFRVTSGNTNHNNENIGFNNDSHQANETLQMSSGGTLELNFYNQYSGVLKIEIKRLIDQTTTFDYDPGYEEYDMYDEFSWAKSGNPATTYNFNNGAAGFQLNGADAKYITLSGSKITANNRIALTGNANAWTFDFGLVPPGTNGDYSYFSICNLREGDRVVISYINESEDPLIFASGYKNGDYYYDGCAAFKDDNRNGVLNDGEEYVNNGYIAPVDWHRGEGNVGGNDQGQGTSYTPELCYINSYVITQDGHLDLAFKRFVENDLDTDDNPHQNPNKKVSRIVKIKIFSDHQAMMVDEYDANSYWAKFNITGELQAKEHIMPGGLEIQIGNDDATQHALVVSSKYGPVSYVNAVDGFKIPGVSKNGDQISINFDLGINRDYAKLPTSGTFYKFIPEVNGKMKFKFEAKSMNYYRWDLKGNSVYQNTSLGGNWAALNDRPNEQTVDATCPYYLVKVVNGQIVNIQSLGNINNGGDYETPNYIDVEVGEEYYLFGGWNQTGLYYNSSWTTPDISNDDRNNDANGSKVYNNIEFRPFDGRTVGCGIAQLLWVEFDPDKKIYPLAKWVPNGTIGVYDEGPNKKHGVPNPDVISYDEDKLEYELADLYGYNDKTSLTVKKMAGNITGCTPFLKHVPGGGQGQHFKLMIKDITFAQNKDKGGTILIKIDDATVKTNPVYTLTIAYSGDPTFDGNSGSGTRGHIWDYSSNSLRGLKYDASVVSQTGEQGGKKIYTHNAAEPEDYGHYFQNYFAADISGYSSADAVFTGLAQSASGKLHDEINSGTSEWMFNYNLVNDGKLYDPVFSNKYDLEADNADLIWDTEGTVIRTSANSSVMFNEFTGENIHQSTVDPERYVGILKGGEFRIPWLMPNDRVIIWMGTGKGAFNDHAVFNIRGAYDALHKEIAESDDYIVGGSQWIGDVKDYKGCYHFFAQGDGNGGPADMVFKMTTGSMCKIYKIQIYRGDRIITNEIVDNADTENPFLLYSIKADPNETSSTNKDFTDNTTHEWALKYLGKEQQMANGTGKNSQENEIIAQTGKYSSATPALTNNHKDAEDETSPVESFTYKHQLGEIGTFRMRGKDMEKNMNYVADYADHNVTIAYQETQKYPYTWDFTDVTGIEDNVTNLFDPEEQLGEGTTAPTGSGLTDDIWNSLDAESYQKTARDLSLWEVYGTSGNYFLRLNSQTSQSLNNLMVQDNIFESAKEIGGNQVWANKTIVPEMQGLWFYTEYSDPDTGKSYDNYQKYGQWNIIQGDANNVGGLEFTGSESLFKKIVIPNVPGNAAVYLRMQKIATTTVKYAFGQGELSDISNSETAKFYKVDGTTNDYIVALLNTNSSKANLTLVLNGYRIQKLAVSKDKKTLGKYGWATESRERIIDPSLTAYLSGKNIETIIATGTDYANRTVTLERMNLNDGGDLMQATSGDGTKYACILHNADEEARISVLDGGFHLFVPDMHDYNVESPSNSAKTFTIAEKSIMKAQLTASQVNWSDDEGDTKNFVLTATYQKVDKDDNLTDEAMNEATGEGFYRVGKNNPITSSGHQGYLPVSTEIAEGYAKFSIVFVDFEDNFQGTTTIPEVAPVNDQMNNENAEWFNLNGQKLNGKPNEGGVYIVNGKKVMVK